MERHGETVLDRIHQSMILFAAGRSEALKRFLVEDGAGQDATLLAACPGTVGPVSSANRRKALGGWRPGAEERSKIDTSLSL